MKVLAATLAVVLLVAICSLAEAVPRDSSGGASPLQQGMASCCFHYIAHRIPRRLITSAYRTSMICPQPAVVLVTMKGRRLCANPEAQWVQKYLKDLEISEY